MSSAENLSVWWINNRVVGNNDGLLTIFAGILSLDQIEIFFRISKGMAVSS